MVYPANVKVTYIWCRGEDFDKSIQEIMISNIVYVVPINYPDEMDDEKSVQSLVYICNTESVFIFDIIMLNENGLPEELIAILYSDLIKYVYSKPITYERLGFHRSHPFGHIIDVSEAGPEFSPYCSGTVGDGSIVAGEIRIEDIDWSVRPFMMGEHIRAGYRFHRLMTAVMKDRIIVAFC